MSLNKFGFNAPKKLSNSLRDFLEKKLEHLQFTKRAQNADEIEEQSTARQTNESSQDSLVNRLMHLQQHLEKGRNNADHTLMAPAPGQLQHFKWVRRQSTEEYRKQKDMLEFDSIFNQVEKPAPVETPKKDLISKLNDTLSFQGKMSIKIDLNLDS